jgi:DNA ligase D
MQSRRAVGVMSSSLSVRSPATQAALTARSLALTRSQWFESCSTLLNGRVNVRWVGMAKANEHGEPVELIAAGHPVEITSPGKPMFPEPGITKLDLARYYLAVEEPIMRTVRDRPTLLQRFPNGVSGSNFFQKRIPDSAPDWLQTTIVSTPNGTTSRAIVMADIAHVLWAANLGCLGFHPWPYRADHPDDTDELRIDLDPSPGVSFPMVQEAATAVRQFLEDNGITSFIKTTGNRGLHVYVRVEAGWDSFGTRQAAVSVARALAAARPDLITDKWWKEERGARVFIDFNQNAPHKTVFGAWCVRARPGAQVSTPFAWEELPQIHPDKLTVQSVPGRLRDQGDPWAEIDVGAQSIAPLVERYERDLAGGIPDAPWPPVYPKMPDEARRVNPSRARPDPIT